MNEDEKKECQKSDEMKWPTPVQLRHNLYTCNLITHIKVVAMGVYDGYWMNLWS